MSLKPPKKSDLNKAWMKKKPDREIKIHPEYHLIVSEGTDTEPAYFGTIRDIINKQYPKKIQLDVSGEGNNTINLFDKAKQLAKDSANVYRHVWVVYDTDDFPAEHIDSVIFGVHPVEDGHGQGHAVDGTQSVSQSRKHDEMLRSRAEAQIFHFSIREKDPAVLRAVQHISSRSAPHWSCGPDRFCR